MKRVAVIGDGGWGTALATVLQANGHHVTVWGPFADYIGEIRAARENRKFLPGVKLPPEIQWTADRAEAAKNADAWVLAVPSKFYEEVVASFRPFADKNTHAISVTKGLDRKTHRRMSEMAADLLRGGPIVALTGPSHAEEVARGIPTAVVAACEDHARAEFVQELFSNPRFRVYTTDDTVGAELGGCLKNVIAIAVGVSDGIGFGDNTRAALITRGLAEMKRLGCALGAHAETFSGLSGMGDLIVTCTSRLSRNRAVGEKLGRGQSIESILAGMEQVAEGVANSASALALAEAHGVEVPITQEVNDVIHRGKNPKLAVQALLTRDPRPERDSP